MVLPQDSYLKFGPYLDLMTGIRTALNINEGIIKVVGAEGSGKTALCRQLVSELKADGQQVIFFESPPESVEYLHKRIQSELDLPRDKNFTRSLTSYLLARQSPNNKLILIYDDAEKISKELFILIRLLNNIHDSSETLVSQVICGTGKLDRVFDDPDLRSLTQYLNQSFTLAPMNRDEIIDFCAGYTKLAGITGKDPSNKEITDLFMVSKGMPGKAFDLLEQLFSVRGAKPADNSGIQDGTDMAPGAANTAGDSPASLYAREVDDILDEDTEGESMAPVYFKVALSVIVVIATIVLALVLSRENEAVNARLASILEDDSPLYLDEVDPEAATTVLTEDVEVPVISGVQGVQANLAESGTPDTEPEVPVTANPVMAEMADESTAALTSAASLPGTEAAMTTSAVPENFPEPDLEVVDAPMDSPEPENVESLLETAATGTDEPQDMTALETTGVDNTPVTVTATEPGSTTEADMQAQLNAAIQRWLDAWESGNYADYLAAYHEDFESPYHDSRQAWETERQARIAGVTGIMVGYDRFELQDASDNEVTVRFWLYYARGSYADETWKEMVFARANDNWLILGERNLELIVR